MNLWLISVTRRTAERTQPLVTTPMITNVSFHFPQGDIQSSSGERTRPGLGYNHFAGVREHSLLDLYIGGIFLKGPASVNHIDYRYPCLPSPLQNVGGIT